MLRFQKTQRPKWHRSRTLFRVAAIILLAFTARENLRAVPVERARFGRTKDGVDVEMFTLTNAHGLVARIISFGATVTELQVPDRDGTLASVVAGSDDLADYERGFPAASVIGRVANRIARGRFVLDGTAHQLETNNGVNHLHGGRVGFSRRVWQGELAVSDDGPAVRFRYRSVDGEEGYPGNLDVTVTYTLTDANTLRLDYAATTDKATPINLTNHAFFNLDDGGDVRAYELTLDADHFTVFDETQIPTGEIRTVRRTPLNFTQALPLGARAAELGREPRYDHNFVLNHDGDSRAFRRAARVRAPSSGRVMEVWTTEPGVQLFTSLLSASNSAPSGTPRRRPFFCLETQHFPDSVNHPEFPSVILRPDQVFHSTTEFRFSVW